MSTADFYNNTGSAQAGKPYVFGQGFRMGDVPTGSYVQVLDAKGNPLTSQQDEVSPAWPDGSMRHCVLSAIVTPSVPNAANYRLQVRKVVGTYSPSTPRSINDITSGHQFQVKFDDVVNSRFVQVGSTGNWIFDVNQAIGAGQYQITANGPVRMAVTVYGYFRDATTSGTASQYLWCEYFIEVFTDPANSARVLYFEHMPLISQPFWDAPASGADAAIGRAILYDAATATTIRDLGADGFSIGPSQIRNIGQTKNGTIDASATRRMLQTAECYKVAIAPGATLPAPLTDGQLVWTAVPNTSNQANIQLTTGPFPLLDQSYVTFTTSGSGAGTPFSFAARQTCIYYQGFFITADDHGTPIRTNATGSAPVFLPNLDGSTGGTAQKAYWQSTGLVPGWDLTLGAGVQNFDSVSLFYYAGPFYRAGSNSLMRLAIQAPGEDIDVGPWCEWDARWFVRMGVRNWSPIDHTYSWANALASANLPYTQVLVTSTHHLPPCDNGPDNVGGSYPVLGPGFPNARSPSDGFTTPNVPLGPDGGDSRLDIWHLGGSGWNRVNSGAPPDAADYLLSDLGKAISPRTATAQR